MHGERPDYWEAVSIGWSILWRGVGSFLLLLFVANLAIFALLPELTRTGPSVWALLLPLLIVTAFSAAFIMPLVVRTLLSKPFRHFRLEFVRNGSAAIGSPSASPFHDRRSDHDADPRNGDPRAGGLVQPPDARGAGRRAG
ncbi:hypothetical protein [Nitrospira moscoviensis]|uniref:Uncharacterized protein n=1 Tax=Nitrospira moscoviensis TaxID=42253 RepID=A0A0K2GDS7_NITMO|nr:hypothetical protein [Nitrospira moscoviensis]ALA59004.1 hypothetical protein NITMOv2_2591 [Nitrospira moscoviensis]